MASRSDVLGDWIISGEDKVDRQMVIFGIKGNSFYRYYQNEQPPNGEAGGTLDLSGTGILPSGPARIAFYDLNVAGILSDDGNTIKDSFGNIVGTRTSFSSLSPGVSKVYQLAFKKNPILSTEYMVKMFFVDDTYVAWTVMMIDGSSALLQPILVYEFSKVDDPQSQFNEYYTFSVQPPQEFSQNYPDWPQGKYTFYFHFSQDGSLSGSVFFLKKGRDDEDTFTATAKSG